MFKKLLLGMLLFVLVSNLSYAQNQQTSSSRINYSVFTNKAGQSGYQIMDGGKVVLSQVVSPNSDVPTKLADYVEQKAKQATNLYKTRRSSGSPSIDIPPTPLAVCTTFNGSLAAGDLTMGSRLSRPGAPTGSCAAAYTTPATIAGGPFFYDTYTWTNTGASTCITTTLTTTDVTNANIQFGMYTGSFVPANLVTNYLADPGVSTGTPAAAAGINCLVTVPAGATIVFLVYSTNPNTAASGTASQYTLTVDGCTAPPAVVCSAIGTGAANTNGSGADPIDGFYNGLHYQTLYTAAQLTAAGLSANSVINSLGWSISEDYGGGNLLNYTVRMGHTTATDCAVHNSATTTQVINPFSYNPTPTAAGAYDMIPFNTNFTWNGTSNILIDICTSPTNPFTSPYGGVRADAVTNGAIFARADGVGATTICAAPTGVSSTNVLSFGVLANRPQVRFCYTASSCTNIALGTQPLDATTTCGGNATFSVAATGTNPTYQWQVNTGSGFAAVSGAVYSGGTTNTLTLTGAPQSYNGYQYRCIVSNTCPSTATSTTANLTITQIPGPSIIPNPASTCLGTTTPLDIVTGGGFGAPVTVTFNSPAALGLAILDGNLTGVNNTINISGIPAGSLISNVSIKLNVAHTWVSDMMVVLKAPNGQIINLSNLCSGTNQSGANFTNTVFSSAGTLAVSTGVRPGYTGTWKADAAPAGGGAFGVQAGPNGFLPTTTTWAPLYTTPNGSWTCAMFDAGPPDVGTFDNWSISITYAPPVPFPGTWTPNTGLFTNAGGTTPYTGTLLSTVYANPAASTTYNVTYTNAAGCLSLPTILPVTVNVPVSITTQPLSTKTCDRQGSTTFRVVAAGTTPTYQWEVFNGTTWSPVANNANYSGATTALLTITQAPIAWNGFKYRCVVSGTSPCGSVTTDGSAVLTVNVIPTITINASPYIALFPGLLTTITANSVPAAASNGYTWSWSGGAIATNGSTLTGIDVDRMGDYSVRVVDINGCFNTSRTITILDSANGKVFIYPSPNKGQFQVRYFSVRGNQLARSLTVFDSKGSKVYSALVPINRPYGRMDVNLSNIGTGVYTVELSDANGKRINTGRVVVIR